jgi:nucleotide-binding universal stress UspA family protein
VTVDDNPHARLALRVARDLQRACDAQLLVVQVSGQQEEAQPSKDEIEDWLQQQVVGEYHPSQIRIVESDSLADGVLAEARDGHDLVVMGVTQESVLRDWLARESADRIAESLPCSVLLLRAAPQSDRAFGFMIEEE